MVITTLPATPDEPVTECFFYPGSMEVLTSLPGFPQPLTHPTSPTFRVDAIPGKGMGLVSTRALKAGDLILSERPLLIIVRGMPVLRPYGFTEEQYIQYSFEHLATCVQVCLNRMRPEARAAYMALANSHPKDTCGPIMGILRTNGLCLDGLRPGVENEWKSYSAVCKDISRLNHSCSPNTQPRFDMVSLSYQLFAVRDIAAGEELTYQYTDAARSAAARKAGLKPYDFVCSCVACKAGPASNARRAAIAAFRASGQAWILDRTLPDDWFPSKCREQLALIAREGLEHHPQYFATTRGMMEAYICLGDAQRASAWAAKLDKILWEETRVDVKALLDPMSAQAAYEAHPLWRIRVDEVRAGKMFST
ncbi:hypothetical protein DFH07DRAFT_913816 [Mycena maculata]|uniref:SET domain-containing protein n=1 Tax=Mycena maculata TaxID=230809 RepID=A0AAD7NRE1_9AGAR|nr:hypothetical protein DFH07DRAFT_913816 [Mycena maculata]